MKTFSFVTSTIRRRSTVMIFIADELDKRKKSSKVLLDVCTVVEFGPLKDAEAKAWAKSRLKELKVTADDQVLSEIIRLVGTDVQTLSNELEKLASAAADTGQITPDVGRRTDRTLARVVQFRVGRSLARR